MGQVIDQGDGRYQYVFVNDANGDTQVYHANYTEQYQYNEGTCNANINFTYANGQTRHDFSSFEGSCPPQS
jgi:hypothetical protein